MTIKEAAHKLWEKCVDQKWFRAITINSPVDTEITLYIRKNAWNTPKIKEYEGYPVRIVEFGDYASLGGPVD